MAQTQLSFRPGAPRPPDGGPTAMTVGALVRLAHATLDGRIGAVWVEGEVSNLRIGAAGHGFFTLKDDAAMLPVAMWRSTLERLRFRLQEGQALRVFGRVGIFAKQGRFQLYADRAEPAGLGARMLELEQRKARLAAAGLFELARKRPLPRWPRTVGVITSAHGAALHDIVQVGQRRCPMRYLVAPAVVQGDEAARSLLRALQRLSRWPQLDVIIIGRGGGSVEDLWAFNDEALAHAIAQCPVPVVSAVGHEVDVTICDLVADVRAATPSQAAELVVPDREALLRQLASLAGRLHRAGRRHPLDRRARLDHAVMALVAVGRAVVTQPRRALSRFERALAQQHPRQRIDRDRQALRAVQRRLVEAVSARSARRRERLQRLLLRLRELGARLAPAASARLAALQHRLFAVGPRLPTRARLRLSAAAASLQALSPLSVLQRGYAVAYGPDGRALTSASAVAVGEGIQVRLWRGTLRATVDDRSTDPEDPSAR
ncbi:MAG: exodeoxyribonuclease VII large subunit [Nannocystaceae bacterium]|nr:exodeoxyribonuclease VII large subunit [Nannocystaceae bacterium]